jgi:hypothetical protein
VTDTFTVCDLAGQFTLAVDNGPGGEPRISSGTVSVNGLEVIHESDFNQEVARIERALTNVTTSNTLAVQLGSQPGGTIAVSVLAVQACGVRITAPAAGTTLPAGAVVVRGTVPASSSSDVGVTVNGTPALLEGGVFATVVPVDSSVTALTARATDRTGATLSEHTIAVTAQPSTGEPAVRLSASPPGGVAPLTVGFRVSSLVGVSQVALDLEGTGAVTFQGPSLDGQVFSYGQPGIYAPTVQVTDSQGQTHTAATLVQVTDSASLDAQLQTVWAGAQGRSPRGRHHRRAHVHPQ